MPKQIFNILLLLLVFMGLNHNEVNAQKSVDEFKDKSDLVFDSLITELDSSNDDTLRVKFLNEIAWNYAPTNYKKSIEYADSALSISKYIYFRKGSAIALKIKGEAYRYKGDYKRSLSNFKEALNIFQDLEDEYNYAAVISNIGITYYQISDFAEAQKYYSTALNTFLALDNKPGIQKLNILIGVLLSHFKDYEGALNKFNQALNISEELGDKSSIASIYGNIGNVYYEQKKLEKANNYYNKALNLFESIKDQYNYLLFLSNIANLYLEQNNLSEALRMNKLALDYANKIGNKGLVAIRIGYRGKIKYRIAKEKKSSKIFNEAINDLNTSISKLSEIGNKEKQLFFMQSLAELYSEIGKFKEAYQTNNGVIALTDSIFSVKINKKIAKLSVQQDLKLQEKQIEFLNKEKEYQKFIKNVLLFIVGVLLLFGAYFFTSNKKRKEQNIRLNKIINQKKIVEKELKKKQNELEEHKRTLSEKVEQQTKELKEEIAERKKTEENLIVAIERVEAANKAKTVFLENMSHELRTPLVGILGYSSILKNDLKTKEFKEMADGINRTGTRLLNTLSMVLDLARIESDKFEINLKSVDLGEELKGIYNNFKGAVALKNIDFNLELDNKIGEILIDEGMLKVIVENLLNNAIKFTTEGNISLKSELQENGNKKFVDISVSDTGIGIHQDQIDEIFKEFKQLSEGKLKAFQGTGLGLSISKKFSQHLGGDLFVNSELKVGSKFTFRFPLN